MQNNSNLILEKLNMTHECLSMALFSGVASMSPCDPRASNDSRSSASYKLGVASALAAATTPDSSPSPSLSPARSVRATADVSQAQASAI